jgi:hypothetical protein
VLRKRRKDSKQRRGEKKRDAEKVSKKILQG